MHSVDPDLQREMKIAGEAIQQKKKRTRLERRKHCDTKKQSSKKKKKAPKRKKKKKEESKESEVEQQDDTEADAVFDQDVPALQPVMALTLGGLQAKVAFLQATMDTEKLCELMFQSRDWFRFKEVLSLQNETHVNFLIATEIFFREVGVMLNLI